VAGHGDTAVLVLHSEVTDLDLIKLNLS
jgi:hypothetical protein